MFKKILVDHSLFIYSQVPKNLKKTDFFVFSGARVSEGTFIRQTFLIKQDPLKKRKEN